MKIGVFGDSFANKKSNKGWWNYLKQYGHHVTSYGEDASSLLFSAKLIENNIKDFDFVIWCVTNTVRLSIKLDHQQEYLHFSDPDRFVHNNFDDLETRLIIDITKNYLKHVHNYQEQEFVGRIVVENFQKYDNLMFIPCFPDPLYSDFCLCTVSENEIQKSFSKQKTFEIYQKYQDLRECHLNETNNQILAKVLSENLKPGIFTTNYDIFDYDADIKPYFKKWWYL